MDDALAIYLHDHLAGAVLAVDLLKSMRDKHSGEELGQFAETMLIEVEADRSVLKSLADRVGKGSSPMKEAGAWLSEKVSKLKLDRGPEGLGVFEALEFLALGILGKLSLWTALGAAAPSDARLQGLDFAHLAERAKTQHAIVDARRLEAAKFALPKR